MWLDVSKKVLGQEIDMRFLNSSLRNWFFSLFFWLLSKTSNRIELFFLSLTMKMQLLEINYRKKKFEGYFDFFELFNQKSSYTS